MQNPPVNPYNAPVDLRLQRAVGVAALLAGLPFAFLFCYALFRSIGRVSEEPELILGVLSVLGVIAGFLLSVGWRLAFNKPNKYRSLLAPNAWFAICILFVLLGTWLAFKLLTTGQVVHLDAPAYSLALGIAAGVVGLRARRRASRGTNAA